MKYLNKNLIKKPMEFTKMLKNGKNNFSLINLICFFIYFWRSRVYRLIMKHTSIGSEKNSVGTEFSRCKTAMDRMNVTSVMRSLSM